MNDNVILDQEVEQAPKLTLEDDTGTLLRKRIVKINAAGSKESLRRMRDGYTFFGPVDIYVSKEILNIEKLYHQ